jgi:hypothetical protein
MEERIKTRIAELEKGRDDLIKQAEAQLQALNGAITELKRLLEPEESAIHEVK